MSVQQIERSVEFYGLEDRGAIESPGRRDYERINAHSFVVLATHVASYYLRINELKRMRSQ